MATQIRFRRGNTTLHSTFTGADGEMTIDTTKNTMVVHDGSTTGGFPLALDAATAVSQGEVDDLIADVATETSKITSLAARPRRNMLINGGMKFWQRGLTHNGPASTYTADRWWTYEYTLAERSQDTPDGVSSHCMKITPTTNASSQVRQLVENMQAPLEGKTVTLSFWAKADTTPRDISVGIAYQGTPATKSLTTSWQRFSHTHTVGSVAVPHLIVDFNNLGNTATWMLTNVQLELGSEMSDFEVRDPAFELALCQRYYEKSYDRDAPPGAVNANGPEFIFYQLGSSVDATGKGAGQNIAFQAIKARTPTVTAYSPTTGAAGKVRSHGGTHTDTNAEFLMNSDAGIGWYTTGHLATWLHFSMHWTAEAEITNQ